MHFGGVLSARYAGVHRRFVVTTRVFVCRYAAGQAEDAQAVAAIVYASFAACYSV